MKMSIEKAKELGKHASKSGCLKLSLIKDLGDEEHMAFVDSYVPFGCRGEEYNTEVFTLFKDYFANNTDEVIALSVYNHKEGITLVTEKVYQILLFVGETGKLSMSRDFPNVFLTDEEIYQLVINLTINHTGMVSNSLKQHYFNDKVTALIDGGRYIDENGVGRWGGGVTVEQLAGLTAEEIKYVCSYLVDGDMDHKMSVAAQIKLQKIYMKVNPNIILKPFNSLQKKKLSILNTIKSKIIPHIIVSIAKKTLDMSKNLECCRIPVITE